MPFSSRESTNSPSMMAVMPLKFSSVSRLKWTISSTRLMNSGRRKLWSAFMVRASSSSFTEWPKPTVLSFWSLPALEVMMMTVFSKLTVRPWESVTLPSSRIWSSTFSTSGCAFSISSNRMTA